MPCAIDIGLDDMGMPIVTMPLPSPLNPVYNSLGSPMLEADQLIPPLIRADLYVHPNPSPVLYGGSLSILTHGIILKGPVIL